MATLFMLAPVPSHANDTGVNIQQLSLLGWSYLFSFAQLMY